MDFPHNLHDAGPVGPVSDGRLHLPANVPTVMAEDLRAALVFAADHEEAIRIDASETTSIGQAALQLLVAARMEAERLHLTFAIEHARPELTARLATLGLADLLGLTVEEGQH